MHRISNFGIACRAERSQHPLRPVAPTVTLRGGTGSADRPVTRRDRRHAAGHLLTVVAVLGIALPAAAKTFTVTAFRVTGSRSLPTEQVEEAVYPFTGPDRDANDIEHARAALESAYEKAGYPTVSVAIPRQSIAQSGGVIVLAVTERPVGRLRITGSRYFLPSSIRAAAPSLAPGTVPNMHRVQDDLVGLNQLPDRTVQPSLKPGRDPDTVDVDLAVNDKLPLHGTLELNNRYNADTTALRLAASLTDGNLFQRGDSATIAYQVAPENVADAEISSASYLFHIPQSRLSLLVSYLHSNSNVIALGSTDVAGRGTTAGFRLLVPLGTTASFSHSASIGWDYKKYYELDSFLNPPSSSQAPVTYYPVNAAYSANWTGARSNTDLTLSLEFGLPHLGSGVATFDQKRFGAVPGFSVLRAGATRVQQLPYGIEAWASLGGQISNEPLVSSEQLSLGGTDSVRGYLEAETLGDYGLTLQTELRSPSLAKYVGGPLESWKIHLFGDAGVVNNRQTLPDTRSSYGLSSVGIGTRVNLWGYLNGVVQDAQTLDSGVNTKAGTNRVLFRVYGEF